MRPPLKKVSARELAGTCVEWLDGYKAGIGKTEGNFKKWQLESVGTR
jgi:hypothetical protein